MNSSRSKKEIVVGEKYEMLTCIKKLGEDKFLFECECGAKRIFNRQQIFFSNRKHCGDRFVHPRHKTFGFSHTRIDNIYKNMIARCYKQSSNRYHRYGERGIRVCDEWKNDKTKFFEWAFNNGYSDTLTIDRIDNNGNYEPNNCRWVTQLEQARHTSQTRFIEYQNKMIPLQEYAKIMGLTKTQIWRRVKNNTLKTIKGVENIC